MTGGERTAANGWPCKHVILTGGERVPYGSTWDNLPIAEECDNPDVPDEDSDKIGSCETCPFYVPDPDFVKKYCGEEDCGDDCDGC